MQFQGDNIQRRNKLIAWISVTAILVVLFVVFNYHMVWLHEYIHQSIFKDYGVESEIVMNAWGLDGGYTNATNFTQNMTETDFRFMVVQQNMNEVWSYQFHWMFIIMFGMLSIIITVLVLK